MGVEKHIKNLAPVLALILVSSGCGISLVRPLAETAASGATDAGGGGGAGGSGSGGALSLSTWLVQLGATTKATGAPVTANQGGDYCNGVATDSNGNIYCAGNTGGDLSEVNGGGGGDAFVLKMNSDGVLQWVTQLGAVTKASGAPGTANQGFDSCSGVAVDSSGNVYCAGNTYGAISEANGGGSDAFVMKLNSSGALQWVTQLGAVTIAPGAPGTANQGSESCSGVAVDSSGNVYCAGHTTGAISEANAGNRDAFVMKLNSSGVIQWATQLGAVTTAPGAPGTANQGYNACYGAAVDTSGNVYCAGETGGALSEASGGSSDAFVMKLNTSGVIQWATQLGAVTKAPGAPGTANQGSDFCNAVAVDSSGNVYCAGQTGGAITEANGGSDDAFVMKLNSSGAIQWATQLGAVTKASGAPVNANQDVDVCYGVASDSSGNVYCAGYTWDAISEANGGGGGRKDVLMMKLNSSGVLQWATQLGAVTKAPGAPGTANQGHDICYGVAVDPAGNVICAGSTGGALSELSGGFDDVFALKLDSTGAF